MSETEPQGLAAMAGIASNLTLTSVLSTLICLKQPGTGELQELYNKGVQDCIDVIKVYQDVLTAEGRKLTDG